LNAEIDLRANDLVLAEKEARNALDDPHTAAQAHYLLGEIAARRGRDEEADQHWDSAIKSNPSYVPARIALANSALKAADPQKAEQLILDVVRNEPANVDALIVYARALTLQKRYDAARALCQRVWAANPRSAEAPILLGEIALDRHQYAIALVEYEKAMLLAPYSERAIVGLTNVYAESGADRALIGKLEKLAESGTPSSRLMEIAGRVYERRHMYPEALRCLHRAAEMDPMRQSAQIALARTYAEMDRKQDAQTLLIEPESIGLASNERRSPLFIALRAEKGGDQLEAARQYEAAVLAGDPSGIASNNLAWIYATEGQQLDHAEQLARYALEVNPGSPQALDTLGMIQLESRQFTRAIASFRSGLQQASEADGMEDVRVAIQSHLSAALQAQGSTVK
jgi:tetratricopeptide (TPR) repeat protein